ncbi:MAG: sugar kinase, partial [Planctomycetota bacterium]
MSLVVVGSVAFDSIETPVGSIEDTLGGSAVHFSLASAFFGPVQL